MIQENTPKSSYEVSKLLKIPTDFKAIGVTSKSDLNKIETSYTQTLNIK